jgi:hypothetical protein
MINERGIALRKGGNYTNLDDYFDRRRVVPLPFNETASVVVAGANVILINSTMTVATKLAIGLGTTENAGLFAALLAGAVGTGSINTTSDTLGNVLNMVRIRDATTHDAIKEASGREVYALIQAVSTANDGDAIGAGGSENVQLSFVYVASNGTLTLTSVTATVEFVQNNVYVERNTPTIMMQGGNPDADALDAPPVTATQGEYVVTTAFTAGEVITLATGAGAGSGVTTKTGDTLTLGASAAEFFNDHLLQVMLNGVEQRKAVDIIWDSNTTFHFALALDVDDYFEVRQIT